VAITDNQFGFESQHATDMCIFLLKQTVSYYTKKRIANIFSILKCVKAFDGIKQQPAVC